MIQRISRELLIGGIDVSAGRVYRIRVRLANHSIVQFFVTLAEGRTTGLAAPVPVVPEKVVNISAPEFATLPPKFAAEGAGRSSHGGVAALQRQCRGYLRGGDLYAARAPYPLLKACFLDIVAKSGKTGLPNGGSCLYHFQGILRLELDRFLVRTTAALVEETGHSNAFHAVSAAMHGPMPGYHVVFTFKTFDRYGNLQLTLQRRGDSGDDYEADADIDDAQGFEHIFQVLRNAASGPINPCAIHGIVLQQMPQVNPGYASVFAVTA